MTKPLKIQTSMAGGDQSALSRYMDLVVGQRGWLKLLVYEAVVMIAQKRAGALGLLLRKKMYPWVLGSVGRNVTFGSNVVIRHPHKIHIGEGTVVDENALLDAKGDSNQGIDIGAGSYIGRNSIISCKNGDISLGENANIGWNCTIAATSRIRIGRDCIIAAYSYIIGGGNYHYDNIDTPMCQSYDEQGKGGVDIEDDVWLGSHVAVLDGVKIAQGCVVASGSTVTKDLPTMSISLGSPAKPVRQRLPGENGESITSETSGHST
ncbi:MAG: DapH/DapD/GlmU-related protein [bacterium]